MKILSIASVAALALLSFGSFAQSVSVTASTLDGAEAKIAALALLNDDKYEITSANTNNRVYMTARLYK